MDIVRGSPTLHPTVRWHARLDEYPQSYTDSWSTEMSDQTTLELLQGYGFLRLFPRFPQELFSETYPQGSVVAGSEQANRPASHRASKRRQAKEGGREDSQPDSQTARQPDSQAARQPARKQASKPNPIRNKHREPTLNTP